MDKKIHVIHSGIKDDELVFAERKGVGHPDTLADNLAELLSRNYSKYTLDNYGAILHHNFDKTGLLSGKSRVAFGEGKLISPIRALVNGRVSTTFGGEAIPYEEIIVESVYEFFKQRFGSLVPKEMISIELNISTASSPGHSEGDEARENVRNYWFAPRDLNDLPERSNLFSNDTSIGCGYYPLHPLEKFLLQAEKELTTGSFASAHKWAGKDVKIMGSQIRGNTDITLCVPQIANYVPSLAQYKKNIGTVKTFLNELVKKKLTTGNVNFHINTRDNYETKELYLTAIGSSIESGDEGLVGRGNRVNQIININRPMSMEGASGKNPVYHVGKLYYIAANKIAKAIYDKFGFYNEVYLVSQSGRALIDPWKTVIKVSTDKLDTDVISEIEKFALNQLKSIPEITKELVNGKITIS